MYVSCVHQPAPFEDTASTCGADTCTVTAVDSGKGGNYSKANETQTEAQRLMLRLWHAKQRATEILQKALSRYRRNTSAESIDDFEKLFQEHKCFIPARSDLYMKCQTLIYDIRICSHCKTIYTCTFYEYFIHAKTTTKKQGVELIG